MRKTLLALALAGVLAVTGVGTAQAAPIWYACTDRLGITIYTTSLTTVANYRAWFGRYACICVPGPVPR